MAFAEILMHVLIFWWLAFPRISVFLASSWVVHFTPQNGVKWTSTVMVKTRSFCRLWTALEINLCISKWKIVQTGPSKDFWRPRRTFGIGTSKNSCMKQKWRFEWRRHSDPSWCFIMCSNLDYNTFARVVLFHVFTQNFPMNDQPGKTSRELHVYLYL